MNIKHALLPLLAASTLALAACGSDAEAPNDASGAASSNSAQAEQSSTTSAQEASQQDNPEQGPQRIVAATSDTAALALQITQGQRIVAVPATAKSETSGASADLARNVEGSLPPGTNPDVEQVLSFEPDLVLTTARHGGEKTFSEQLEATGVKTLSIDPELFNTPEGVAQATRQIGEAVAQPQRADEVASNFEKTLSDEDKKAKEAGISTDTTALALMVRGPKTMVMDSGLMVPSLATRAGATYAADTIGVTNTSPIDAEQLLKANPDVLFLEDFRGGGRAAYAELLDNPAVADVPAIKNDRVVVVSMKDASAVSGLNTVEGYKQVVEALKK